VFTLKFKFRDLKFEINDPSPEEARNSNLVTFKGILSCYITQKGDMGTGFRNNISKIQEERNRNYVFFF